MSENTNKNVCNITKRDELLVMEIMSRNKMNEKKYSSFDFFNKTSTQKYKGTFMATFPYPYMNGNLHLGHCFTGSKQDFMSKYKSCCGYDVLQPFAFHTTGMPIVAASTKLRKEINMMSDGTIKEYPEDSQYNIMLKMGINESMIPKFTHPKYWCEYFPICAIKSLDNIGISYDPTRTFITTDINPYYDQFVKWQFDILHKKGVLKFGKRYDLFSISDNQPCVGHDRASGEDAVPSKGYIIEFDMDYKDNIKILVMTSRPETVYGVTNLWIDPKATYSVFKVNFKADNDNSDSVNWLCYDSYVIESLKYQLIEGDYYRGKITSYEKLYEISGIDMITNTDTNIVVRAKNPITQENIPIVGLNFQHIDASLKVNLQKGTGIVMCVPSDSPIDYIGYINADIETKYGMMVRSIISVESETYHGNMMAYDMIKGLIVEKDFNGKTIYTVPSKDLKTIKDFCYTASIPHSKMNISNNELYGMSVTDARAKVQALYNILTYYEPDKEAYSRSGDRLIVAKIDQWFIDYGNSEWKQKAHNHVNEMTFNDDVIRNQINIAIDWLDQWPCSRSYGLGTYIPFDITGNDNHCLIDSLSDSTIYMAFYTICNKFGVYQIRPEDLTYDVFDFIFLLKNHEDNKYAKYIPLRDEFMHWYPFDTRVSAKDLIMNHLTMCIFNHVLVWDDEFMQRRDQYYPNAKPCSTFGPRRYDINGYITVMPPNPKCNDKPEKMSKSKGNFKTIDQAMDMYTADTIRFTCASASIGSDDALFDQTLCDRMIEKFHKEKLWLEETLKMLDENKYTRTDLNFPDEIFLNEMKVAYYDTVQAYERFDFRAVVTSGYHILQGLRDSYVFTVGDNVNPNVIRTFINNQLSLMYPIIPFFCTYFSHNPLYQKVMNDNSTTFTINNDVTKDDMSNSINYYLYWVHRYLTNASTNVSRSIQSLKKKRTVTKVIVYIAKESTDPIEILAMKIFNKLVETNPTIKYKSGKDIDNEIVINLAKEYDPEFMTDNNATNEKKINSIIREVVRICEMYGEYGFQWFNDMINGNISEYDAFQKYFTFYHRIPKSSSYDIEFVNYDNEYATNTQQVTGVKLNAPVFVFKS